MGNFKFNMCNIGVRKSSLGGYISQYGTAANFYIYITAVPTRVGGAIVIGIQANSVLFSGKLTFRCCSCVYGKWLLARRGSIYKCAIARICMCLSYVKVVVILVRIRARHIGYEHFGILYSNKAVTCPLK